VNEETGQVLLIGIFEQSASLLLSSEGNRSAIDVGDTVETFKVDYPMVFVQTTKGLTIVNLVTADKVMIPLTNLHWFTMVRKSLYIFHGSFLRKITLDKFFPESTHFAFRLFRAEATPSQAKIFPMSFADNMIINDVFTSVVSKDTELVPDVDIIPQKDARNVIRDESSSSVLLLSRPTAQLWSFTGAYSSKGSCSLQKAT
jgi:hypothetical protein